MLDSSKFPLNFVASLFLVKLYWSTRSFHENLCHNQLNSLRRFFTGTQGVYLLGITEAISPANFCVSREGTI